MLLPGVVAVLAHHAEAMCIEGVHRGLVVATSRIDISGEGVLVVRVVVLIVRLVVVVLIGLLHGEAVKAVAGVGRVRANHDEAVRLVGGERCEELLGLVFGDAAVDVEDHRVLTVLESVLLDVHGVAVDDVADAGVAPQLKAAGVDEGVEHPIEQLVRPLGVESADDVGGVLAHVVAEAQDVVGVDGVVRNARGVLPGHLSGLDEQGGVRDDQCADAFIISVEVDKELGDGHACSLGL